MIQESPPWAGEVGQKPPQARLRSYCSRISAPEFRRERAGRLRGRTRSACQELPAAARGQQLAAIHDHLAARDHHDRPAGQRHAGIGAVAGRIVGGRGVDLYYELRVPDREIGVRADRDRALFRMQTVDRCCLCGLLRRALRSGLGGSIAELLVKATSRRSATEKPQALVQVSA
jgi:hypothetical protein